MPKNSLSQTKVPRIALVHDYLREYGGAERVLEALHDLFPDAPVYVAFTDPTAMGRHWQKFADWHIQTTWLAQIPGIRHLFSPLRILAPKAFSDLDLSAFDVVISSSNAYFAKAVRVRAGARHICYCHTPPRALYGYTTKSNWRANSFTRVVGEVMNHFLRIADFQMAQRVTQFVANSAETQRRIQKFYRRDSMIIYPPVDVEGAEVYLKKHHSAKEEYYLYVNRLALAKHPELAVQVCTQLDKPLKVVGSGPMLEDLKKIAGPTIQFMGAVDDEELHALYAGAKALLYPVEDEDFGMVPVEAMAHGTPVIAHASGGVLETVEEEQTGLFFYELSVAGLTEALLLAERYTFSQKKCREKAQHYSCSHFKKSLLQLI